jgi:cytochrome bd-type quinol oxidase subunit 1
MSTVPDTGGATPPVVTSGFSTSEFTALMTTLATTVISVLAMVFKWTPDITQTWTGIATAVIAATAVIIANVIAGIAAWKYIGSRQAVKTAMIEAHYSYAQQQIAAGQPVRTITV